MAFLPGDLHHNYTHGQCGKHEKTGAYKSWKSMRERCNPANADRYPAYAGSGISVCARWQESFENFYNDMGDRPDGHTIDRIDPCGDYTPENCRWADNKTQALNRSNTIMVDIDGESLCLRDASKKYGIPNTTIARRYKQGLRGRDLICKKNRNIYRNGSKSPSSKLTEEDVHEIKRRIMNGERNKDLARLYGVSGPSISEIRHGKTWMHVPWPQED